MLKNGNFSEMVNLVIFKGFLLVKNLEILIQIIPDRSIYYYWQCVENVSTKWYFFNKVRNCGLILNVDWFEPFKHLNSFTVGAIYLVILNLSRHLQFKEENVILVRIIPDLAKVPHTNSCLSPLIRELNEAWVNGFHLHSSTLRNVESFHLALLCVGCDIPTRRKICGFFGI